MNKNSKKLVEIIWKYLEPFDLTDEEKSFVEDLDPSYSDDFNVRADSNQLGKFETYDPFEIIDKLVNIIEKGDINYMESEDYELFSFAREMNHKNSKNHIATLCGILSEQSRVITDIKAMNKKSLEELDKKQAEIYDLKVVVESMPEECEHYDHCAQLAIDTREPAGI